MSLLANKFSRKADVVNRGFSGYNVRMLKSVLPFIATKSNLEGVVALVIFIGANDANYVDIKPDQAVPIEEYDNVLGDIINEFLDAGVEREKIVLISPPPVNASKWLEVLQRSHGKENWPKSPKSQELTKQYADRCGSVAKRSGCRFYYL